MKILNVNQIRELDQSTIEHEPIAPINLMERASLAFVDWFARQFPNTTPTKLFCGLGNNGGDGLAIARLLLERNYPIEVYVVRYAPRESDDFMHNHRRLKLLVETIHYVEHTQDIPALRHNEVLIDAILGSGLSRPTEGIVKSVIESINRSPATVVSVDIASGLFADQPNEATDTIIEPDYTITFQLPKLAFMLPANGKFVGDWHIVDIRLRKRYIDLAPTPYYFTQPQDARLLLRKRERYSNKGSFGHALLIAGSYGKIGAAVLAAKACLRSGVGLLTVQIPRCGYDVLQTAVPEAMCRPDGGANVLTGTLDRGISEIGSLTPADYATVGVGPGIGKAPETLDMLKGLLRSIKKPMVLDADALNLIAENRELLKHIPKNSILTPHPKEFERLTKKWENDYEKLDILRDFAKQHRVVVVLKGAFSAIATPEGDIHFNSTGNPGLSTGGTGDVLTGVLTALLAQNYDSVEAAVLGVFAHGLAGDRVARQRGPIGMTASDVIDALRWE
ncbi:MULTISPECIES: NAD(P)H-hydrate dehydratase [unclassified Spirosoma]|uniref:NAD(P)H-hydrate dehydratase n=1 Tax=unclassified Spirosoma TaxID=2621999 RepID=UPI000968F2FE|nr:MULTISPECIES: NAD(P)H-hydrate dehydratase [unclassified Spirosoma]MBN8825218.1 NAD(P)H-hydrate dehydratase [Spirosoma sp.]OJW75292.1 MAG: bifunctional ADP-dependent (S)-NAD(P)H-hydrate dehydratase/NAD(P)H-hydrate epimerase [Spirosoma sp. 48-14]